MLVLYHPESTFSKQIASRQKMGVEVTIDIRTVYSNLVGDSRVGSGSIIAGASTFTSTNANPQPKNSQCGQYCWGRTDMCTGSDGCTCIADSSQGNANGFFTASCKLPFSVMQSSRGLSEIDSNPTESANSTTMVDVVSVADLDKLMCPCNCTYVSKACCSSTSGIVYESAASKLGALQPPNNSMVCNSTTGDMQPVG